MTILVDIDGVLNKMLDEWVDRLNKKWGTSVKVDEIQTWDMSKTFPQLSNADLFAPLNDDDFWLNVKPMDGACEYLKKLIDIGFYDVYLCTSTSYHDLKNKVRHFLKMYFPYIEWSQVIICSTKQMVNGDYLIDDYEKNLEGGNYNKMLFTQSYNKDIDCDKEEMIRVNSWEEIYKYFYNLAMLL